jgi:transposase
VGVAGRKFVVEWRHSAEELRGRYRAERDPQLARRWQALWLLRQGRSLGEVAPLVGVAYRTVQEWAAWYRAGGLQEVARHRVGGLRRPIRPLLSPAQEAALVQRAGTVGFATRRLALAWLAEQFGAALTMRQLERLFARLRLRLKVPRPLAARADPAAQAAWKGGGSPSS